MVRSSVYHAESGKGAQMEGDGFKDIVDGNSPDSITRVTLENGY